MPSRQAFTQVDRDPGTYTFQFVIPVGSWKKISIVGDIPEADIDDALNNFDAMVAVEVSGKWRNLIGFGWRGGYALQPGETSRQPSAILEESEFVRQIGGLAGKNVRIIVNVGRRMSVGFDIEVL